MNCLIINNIAEAKYFVDHLRGVYNNLIIMSTHVSVNVFLKEEYNIDCICLSSLMTTEEVSNNIAKSDKAATGIVDMLDKEVQPMLNLDSYYSEVRLFSAIYAYNGYFQYDMYLNLYQSIEKAIDRFGISNIIYFRRRLNEFIDCPSTLKAVVNLLGVKHLELEELGPEKYPGFFSRIIRYVRHPVLTNKKIRREISRRRFKTKTTGQNSIILLFDPLYDMGFLYEYKNRFNFLVVDNDLYQRYKGTTNPVDLPDISVNTLFNDPLGSLLAADIIDDFKQNASLYLDYLDFFHNLIRDSEIRLGIWGVSPVNSLSGLGTELLMKKSIPVIGCQHGGLFGNQFNHDPYISDLSRCSHYISYGFTEDDLSLTFPGKQRYSHIYPLGTMKQTSRLPKRKKADIFFPITNTIPMLSGGMMREKPDLLLEKQTIILRYLDSLASYRVVVKPIPNSNSDNLAVLSQINRMKNVTVIKDLSTMELLDLYEFRCAIVEQPSTPIYELLDTDIELFMLHDSVRPIESGALCELEKRVYCFYNISEMINKIDCFLTGDLAPRRDNTFFNHYVRKPDTEAQILELVRKLL